MYAIICIAISSVVATAQRPYGSYGNYGGYGSGGFVRPIGVGGSIGGGGSIIFPDTPVVLRPIGGVHSTGGFPTSVISGTGGEQFIGGLQGIGVQPVGSIPIGGISSGGLQTIGGVQQVGDAHSSGQCNKNQIVHASQFGSDYHFSWCADGGQKYEWQDASQVCSRLGPGWSGISIEDFAENEFVTQTIAAHNLEYIWTGGQRTGLDWSWPSGRLFTPIAWSHTGLLGRPQPDNQEDNIENCLAILNNFYQDGIKWHDVACYHPKPIICERSVGASAPVHSLPVHPAPVHSAPVHPFPVSSVPVPGYG